MPYNNILIIPLFLRKCCSIINLMNTQQQLTLVIVDTATESKKLIAELSIITK